MQICVGYRIFQLVSQPHYHATRYQQTVGTPFFGFLTMHFYYWFRSFSYNSVWHNQSEPW